MHTLQNGIPESGIYNPLQYEEGLHFFDKESPLSTPAACSFLGKFINDLTHSRIMYIFIEKGEMYGWILSVYYAGY